MRIKKNPNESTMMDFLLKNCLSMHPNNRLWDFETTANENDAAQILHYFQGCPQYEFFPGW